MTMRVALVSDIHGNDVALRAVLDDAEKVGVDRVVCLGDTATLGPRPRETLAILRDRNIPCILGNHDEFMLDESLIRSYTEAPPVVAAVDWCRAELSSDDIAFIGTFHRTLDVALDGSTLFLFHGSPASNMQDLLATTPPDELDALLGAKRAPVMAGGHTHIQMMRQHRGALLVNPGSVGMPFEQYVSGRAPVLLPHAEYAIVEAGAVSLRRVAVDVREMRDAAETSKVPMKDMLIQYWV
jgi:putative phosphoesterase